jgi:integrase
MYEVGCTYGWRVSEIKGLRVRHIDIGAHTIRLDPGTTKNGQGRVVTFEAQSTLCELLAACVHGKSADDFAITRDAGKLVRDFRKTWAKVCEAAGSPGLLFHDLRRTAARNLRRAGVAENVIMQIGGGELAACSTGTRLSPKMTSWMRFASWRLIASNERLLL